MHIITQSTNDGINGAWEKKNWKDFSYNWAAIYNLVC